MNDPIKKVLTRLPDVEKSGDGWKARCPAHKDERASLSIRQAEDRRVLLHCHAGCSTEAVLAAVGLTMKDLFPGSGAAGTGERRKTAPPTKPRGRAFATREDAIRSVKGKPVGEWVYHDAHGKEVFRVVRFDVDDGKSFRPIHKHEKGWSLSDPPGPLPLYGLPELAGAERVYVVEGEKCADAARSIGLTATTSAHGCQSPEKTDWQPLAGRDVVILPDNDAPGQKYARSVAAILLKLNPPAKVRIVELPGLPEKGDIIEYIEMNKNEKGAEHNGL